MSEKSIVILLYRMNNTSIHRSRNRTQQTLVQTIRRMMMMVLFIDSSTLAYVQSHRFVPECRHSSESRALSALHSWLVHSEVRFGLRKFDLVRSPM